MNADSLKELFEPFGAVEVKHMFGGAGVYAEGLCFAIESGDEVFLKVDAETEKSFLAAGLLALHLQRKGQADDHVLLASAIGRLRRAGRTAPMGGARTRGRAPRVGGESEAERQVECDEEEQGLNALIQLPRQSLD